MAVPDTGQNAIGSGATEKIIPTSLGKLRYGVTVKNDPASTDIIWVGWDSSITKGTSVNSGYPLEPGDSYFFKINESLGDRD